ncbi:cation:proton antiporter [Chromatiales bacterium (ex Bugula neritina AB1)]|nr:cation:proton antiporter [Chromatiales bacterium (ex Bugula neritina AB1)]
MLVATVFVIIRLEKLMPAVMMMGFFSLLSSCIFMVLDAVDVAFTEAAVGAGVSTIFFLAAIAIVGRTTRPVKNEKKILPLITCIVTGAILIYATFDMPRFGSGDAPIHQHVAPRYLNESAGEVGPPNVVTSVLASYRGYDTLGEVGVVFTAFIGVFLLLGAGTRKSGVERPAPTKYGEESMRQKIVLREVSDLVIAPVLVFALYVQWHGDFGPGGGFQAGVIFASGIILYALIYGIVPAQQLLPPRKLAYLPAVGLLLYAGVGVVSMLKGGEFLNYSVLVHDPLHGQHYGILIIELGVGITVAAVMINIFFSFSERSL